MSALAERVEPKAAPQARCNVDPRFRLTYAVTPPNQTTSPERRRAIAALQSARVSALPVEAVLVYDVQDEAARNGAPRPFPFVPKVDPLSYAFDELDLGALPRVVYRAVGEHAESSLCNWLDRLHSRAGLAVLVGAPSRHSAASLSLPRAYSLSQKHAPGLCFGGVVIPERHRASGAEDARVWAKAQQGCRFFVSQTVWSVAATRRLLHDLHARVERERALLPLKTAAEVDAPHILLTFSPCGSAQTLEFQQWLGIDVPAAVKKDLLGCRDMFARSIELATEFFAELRAVASDLGLSIGCNVESVSSRGAEIDASIELVQRVHPILSRTTTCGP